MPAIDINRLTDGIALPKELSREIWDNAIKESAIMQLVPRVDLPGPGMSIQVITGDPEADWVGETEAKPVSNSTFATKTMTPYKLAVIELFSKEVVRDLPRLYERCLERLPQSIGKKFDATVFNGTAPGTGFDVLSGVSDLGIGAGQNVYAELVAAKGAVATAGGELNGWAFAPQGESLLLGATDQNGRPLFIDSIASAEGVTRLFGAPLAITSRAYEAGTPNTVGFAGDWSKARYGVVDGINLSISEEATVFDGEGNGISLWQNNMVAVRVEAELGFVIQDDDYFVKFTDEAAPEPEPGD